MPTSMRAALGVGNSRPVRRVGEEKPIQPHTATSVWLNQGKNKQVRLFLSSPDTFNAFRISEHRQRMHVAGSLSQTSKAQRKKLWS